MSTYKQLLVTNPTLEELNGSQIPDACLDVLIVLMKDGNDRMYEIKYFPNDIHGSYVAVSNSNKDARPHEVKGIAGVIAESCGGHVDERGVEQGHPEEIVHYSGKTQVHLAEMLSKCRASLQDVLLLRAEYHNVPEAVYANTGFTPEKLDWTQ